LCPLAGGAGIHLHHAGHRDLLELFEELAEPDGNNTIIYTTHVATMLDHLIRNESELWKSKTII